MSVSFLESLNEMGGSNDAKKIVGLEDGMEQKSELIGLLAASICASLAKHPVEETTCRLRLLGRLSVVQWERVLQLSL